LSVDVDVGLLEVYEAAKSVTIRFDLEMLTKLTKLDTPRVIQTH
jgi:hypothetical protein